MFPMSLTPTDVIENTIFFSHREGPNIDQPRKLRLINRCQFHPTFKNTEVLRYYKTGTNINLIDC